LIEHFPSSVELPKQYRIIIYLLFLLMDYLVYAYLQKKNALAKQQLDYLQTINEVYPVNFKTAVNQLG